MYLGAKRRYINTLPFLSFLYLYSNKPTTDSLHGITMILTTMQVSSESEAIASNGSVFDVVHEFQRLHCTSWKLMAVDFTDTARLNVDLVCVYVRADIFVKTVYIACRYRPTYLMTYFYAPISTIVSGVL